MQNKKVVAPTVTRVLYAENITIPPYYLSVVAQNLGERKKKWAKERARGLPPRKVRAWSPPMAKDPDSSLIVKVNESAKISKTVHCGLGHGTLIYKGGLLSAQHGNIKMYTRNLRKPKLFASYKPFNDLHTLRESKNGILAVASGTDSIFEISKDGKKILWSWWAGAHGFEKDSYGIKRKVDFSADHRHVWYTVWQHTTHVNSALPYDNESVLATFFHQGTLVKIDRKTGAVKTLFAGMKRPHATRKSHDFITFASTVEGIAYRGRVIDESFKLEHSVKIKTNWLQDAQFVNEMWILVDAENARVHFVDRNNRTLAIDQFDPDWDFFEVTLA